MRRHVVIVGGGVSGLSAANLLCQSSQFDVTILEAEDRLGGRIHSIDLHGEKIELGAQWIHGREGNAVYELLSKELDPSQFQYESERYDSGRGSYVAFASGQPITPEVRLLMSKSTKLLEHIETKVKQDLKSGKETENDLKHTTVKHIAKQIWEEKFVKHSDVDKKATDAVLNSVFQMMNTVDGVAANRASCLLYHYYQEILNDDVIVHDSYSILLDVLRKTIPNDSIKLRSKVEAIYWNADSTKKLGIFNGRYSYRTVKIKESVSSSSEKRHQFPDSQQPSHGTQKQDVPVGCQGERSAGDIQTYSSTNNCRNGVCNSDTENTVVGNGFQTSGDNSHEKSHDLEGKRTSDTGERNTPVQVCYVDRNGDRQVVTADHVIVTVSIGVLKKYHRKLFIPNFPSQKQKCLNKMGFGTINKILFYYQKKFWKDGDFPIYFLWDIKSNASFLTKKSWCHQLRCIESWKENFLILWANEIVSDKVKGLSKSDIWRAIKDMVHLFNNDITVPMPDDIIVTKWGQNNNFLGSYSSTGIGETLETKKVVSEPLSVHGIPRVLFAGEAMHESRFSTVDGAYLTGAREAQKLLDLCQ